MTSEIRANTLKNRVGLGTVSFTNTGPVVSGIVTIANSTTEGVTLEDNAGVGNSLKITTPTGYVSIGSGNSTFVHLNTDRGVFYFQKRIFVDEGIIASYDENLILQSPSNTNRIIINKDTGLVSIVNDLDVDGHTNLDNVSVAGVATATTFVGALTGTASGNPTLTSGANNRVITATGANALTGESNLTFDGTTLSVTGAADLAGTLIFQPGGTAWSTTNTRPQLGRQADGELRLGAGSDSSSIVTFYTSPSAGGTLTEKLRINSAGKVGFGTTGSDYALSIREADNNNKFLMLQKSSGQELLQIREDGNNHIIFDGSHASGELHFYTAGSERLRINSSGKSIFTKDAGSTNNTYSIATEIKANTTGSTAANFGPAIYLTHSFSNTTYAGSLITSQCDADVNTTHISFYPRNYGWKEALRILASNELRIISSGNNNDPAHLRLHSEDTSISINDRIGQIRFAGRDAGGSTVSRTGALIQATASNAWDTNQTSGYSATHLEFFTQNNSGTDTIAVSPRLRINSTGETTLCRINTFPNPNNTGSEILGSKLVFGAGIKFEERYPNGAYTDRQDLVLRTNSGYGLGESDKIRFTAGGIVNIGVASPQYAKQVNIQGDNGYTLSLSNQNYTGNAANTFSGIEGRIQCGGGVWTSSGVRFVKDNGTSGDKHSRCELYATDGYSSKIGLVVQPDGQVTKPLQPSFHVGSPYTSGASSGQVWKSHSNAIYSNVGSHYNNSTGRFTAPVDGQYFFFHWGMSNSSGQTNDVYSRKNGSRDQIGTSYNHSSGGQHNQFGCSYVRTLSAGDYVDVYTSTGNVYATTDGRHGGWGGHLIG